MQNSSSVEADALAGVTSLLTLIGEDAGRDGLKDSPARFIKAFKQMTSGYEDDPDQILSRQFDQPFDEMIILNGIDFTSVCEHHFLPFIGTATIGYIPAQTAHPKVVGLSKLARLLDCFARRLQIQERLTIQIADALEKNLDPYGIGVIIRAKHFCMICRGVQKANAKMITSVFRGVLKRQSISRAEFLDLIKE